LPADSDTVNGLAVGLAATAGLCNAAGDILERSSAQHERSGPRESVRLVARLARRPRWLFGVLSSLLGLGLHIAALSRGELAAVQPVLVVELPLAVLGSAVFLGRRLALRDWVAMAVMAAGLVAFLHFLAPSGGDRLGVSGALWAAATATVLGLALVLALIGWRTRGDLRACLLATAGGVGYGLTGVFFSTAAAHLDVGGLGAVLSAWQTWASLATGVASFYLLQNAMAAGRLVVVEPGVTLTNPLVATTWGVVVFGEAADGGAALIGVGGGVALVAAGVIVLAGSPALKRHASPAEPSAQTSR
jgi:uncharacterized membrane protein